MSLSLSTIATFAEQAATERIAEREVHKGGKPFNKNTYDPSSADLPFELLAAPATLSLGAIAANEHYLHYFKGWTYACIEERAKGVAKLEWQVFRTNTTSGQRQREELPASHWLTSLIQQPNDWVTRSHLWKLIVYWLDLTGNAYLYTPLQKEQQDNDPYRIASVDKVAMLMDEMGVDASKPPRQIWVLPANRIQVVAGSPRSGRLIEKYRYYGQGGMVEFDEREICHLKHPHPDVDFHRQMFVGRSLVEAAIEAVEVEQATKQFLRSYFQNDALPAFAIMTNNRMDEAAFNQFRARWRQTFAGARKKGQFALLDEGKSIQTFDGNASKEGLLSIDTLNRDAICIVFGVPEPLLTQKHQNRATADVAEYALYARTILPLVTYFSEELTRHFNKFEVGIEVRAKEFATSDPGEQRADELHRIFSLGVPINTILQERGISPIKNGDVSLINAGPVTLDSIANPPAPPPAPGAAPEEEEMPEEEEPEEEEMPEEEEPEEEEPEEEEPEEEEPEAKKVYRLAWGGNPLRVTNKALQELSSAELPYNDVLSYLTKGGKKSGVSPNKGRRYLRDKNGRFTKVGFSMSDTLDNLRKNGGFSVRVLSGRIPHKGNMVSPYTDNGGVFEGVPTLKDLRRFVDDNAHLLKKKGHYLGGWYEKETGRTHLDISIRATSHKQARAIAKKHNQIAYYNLETGRSHKVKGGTGSKPIQKGYREITQNLPQTTSRRNVHRRGLGGISEGNVWGQPEGGNEGMTTISKAIERLISVQEKAGIRRYVRDGDGQFSSTPGGGSRGKSKTGKTAGASPKRRAPVRGKATRSEMKLASTEADMKYAKSLGIPPAYTNIRLSKDRKVDLQAIATDAKGKDHNYYTPKFTAQQQRNKFSRVRQLIKKMPVVEKRIAAGVKQGDHNAIATLLLVKSGFRPGSNAKTGAEKKAYGATTLKTSHCTVKGASVEFEFDGKHGVKQQHTIKDQDIAAFVTKRKKEGATRLFDTNEDKLNDYVAKIAPGHTAKDFRTVKGTTIAKKAVAAIPKPTNVKEYKDSLKRVATEVSNTLGNSPAMALKAYIDPDVFKEWGPPPPPIKRKKGSTTTRKAKS